MKAPDKIYLHPDFESSQTPSVFWGTERRGSHPEECVEYIRKEALLEWAKKEMERLWELLPDSDNDNPTQMELRYLGQYMQMESLEDKLNSM